MITYGDWASTEASAERNFSLSANSLIYAPPQLMPFENCTSYLQEKKVNYPQLINY